MSMEIPLLSMAAGELSNMPYKLIRPMTTPWLAPVAEGAL